MKPCGNVELRAVQVLSSDGDHHEPNQLHSNASQYNSGNRQENEIADIFVPHGLVSPSMIMTMTPHIWTNRTKYCCW